MDGAGERAARPAGAGRAVGRWTSVLVGGLVLTIVSRLPWWRGSGGGTLVHPGLPLDVLPEVGTVLGLGLACLALLVAALRSRRAGGRLTALVLVLGAGALALLALTIGSIEAVSHPLTRSYSRFAAPDGAQYLLYADSRESGMLAVYEGGPVLWHAVPSVDGDGRAFGTPGYAPCTGRATDTRIVVSCTDGSAPATFPR